MLAALGRRAGVGVIGAVKQAVVIRYRDHGAGASAVCIIRARLAQAVGTLVDFIKSAYLFHGFTPQVLRQDFAENSTQFCKR